MKKSQNPELYKKRLIDAMKKYHGIVTRACEVVGISRNQYYVYYNTDSKFKEQIDEMDDYNLDIVEDKLFQNIMDRDKSSIFFYLKYKGRKRGYVDSSDLNISGGLDINLKNMFGFEDENSPEE